MTEFEIQLFEDRALYMDRSRKVILSKEKSKVNWMSVLAWLSWVTNSSRDCFFSS